MFYRIRQNLLARQSGVAIGVCTVCLLSSGAANSGAYVFAGSSNGVDVITHPTGYTGSGGTLLVNVCIDPTSPFATDMEIPTQNIINTWNELVPTIGNVSFSSPGLGFNQADYESVALHELGHCVGLAHPNLASESGLSGADQNYTKTTAGPNTVFDIDAGVDGVIGSSDDVRSDDVNLHWFDIGTNDPFGIQAIVDSTTFSRDLLDLPVGHNFVANADRDVGALLGYADTEAVMQQGTFIGEAQRTLAADDVHTLRLAAGGLDILEGTTDDYTVELVYQGISTTNCDINIKFDANETGFAVCQLGGTFVSGGTGTHVSITSADIFFNPNSADWYFNQTPNMTNDATVYISPSNPANVGFNFYDEDIIVHDGSGWSMYFDGSDVGLGGPPDLNAFHILDNGDLLLSFDTPVNLGGTLYDDSDIIRFTPTSTGSVTSGSFSMYFDGSSEGFTTIGEDIDAITVNVAGELVISTLGSAQIPRPPFSDLTQQDDDLARKRNSDGLWLRYFDGSDVGFTFATEDIWGSHVDKSTGIVYLTTLDSFTATGLNGDGNDIFICTPGTLGNNTSCPLTLFWDGDNFGLGGERIDALYVEIQ